MSEQSKNRTAHLANLLDQTEYLEDDEFAKIVRLAIRDELRDRPKRSIRGYDQGVLYEWMRKIFREWIVNI